MPSHSIQYTRTADGVNIAYAVRGEGVPQLAVFGWVSHLELLLEWYPPPAEGFRQVLFDKRGTGLSDRHLGDYSMDRRLLDVEAVADAAALDRFILSGTSEGGPLAIAYAATHPERVRRLVLTKTYARGADLNQQVWDAILGLVHAEWGLASEAMNALFQPGATPAEIEFFTQMQRLGANADEAAALWEAARDVDVSAMLPKIQCPTLVQSDRRDRVIPFEAGRFLAAGIPGARFITSDSDRHVGIDPASLQAIRDFMVEELNGEAVPRRAAMREPASSAFRTILFTDVVSSTPLLTQLRDAKMREVMRDHDAVMETAVSGHGGRVVKTIGDAFMAEFAVPSAAVEAAIEAQRGIRERFAASDVPVRIRIGINAGEPIEEDGDLHGASVVIAKRLESAADTNGILVSDVVKQMVTGKDFDFEDRGLVDLKGFDEPVRAWAVRWEDR